MGNGPNDVERRKVERRQNGGRREKDKELQAMEALYYGEIKSLGRAVARQSKALEVVALATRENTDGLRVHVDRCEKDTAEKIASIATKLDGNTKTTDKISATQDTFGANQLKFAEAQDKLADRFKIVENWADPQIKAENNAAHFYKMLGDVLSTARVHWVFKVFAVCAVAGITYLFGGKELLGWALGRIFGAPAP